MGSTPSKARRTAFLVAGLAPSVWLLRRMPIGFFHMAGGWAVILGVLALVPALVSYLVRRTKHRRRVALALGSIVVVGIGLLAMIPAARADARGQPPFISDELLRFLALAGQISIAVWALSADRQRPPARRARDAVAYAAAIFTVSLGAFLGRRLPLWVLVPIVAAVAARFAWLPTPSGISRQASRTEAVRTALFFAWAVAVLALEAQVLTTTPGLLAVGVAFVLGVIILLRLLSRSGANSAATATAGFAAFLPVMFAFVVLMPSLAGDRYLLDIGVQPVPGMVLAGQRNEDGLVTRWYRSNLDRSDAVAALNRAFRSPPVSVWPALDGSSTRGLLFGYRLEARYFARGEHLGASAACSTELHACVALTVRRASD